MSTCGLFLVDQDLFLNFLSSSYSLVTKSGTNLLKRGAKDASRGAKEASDDGIALISHNTFFALQHYLSKNTPFGIRIRVTVIRPMELDLKCLKMTDWNKTNGIGPIDPSRRHLDG